jgi:hypothetical protein
MNVITGGEAKKDWAMASGGARLELSRRKAALQVTYLSIKGSLR